MSESLSRTYILPIDQNDAERRVLGCNLRSDFVPCGEDAEFSRRMSCPSAMPSVAESQMVLSLLTTEFIRAFLAFAPYDPGMKPGAYTSRRKALRVTMEVSDAAVAATFDCCTSVVPMVIQALKCTGIVHLLVRVPRKRRVYYDYYYTCNNGHVLSTFDVQRGATVIRSQIETKIGHEPCVVNTHCDVDVGLQTVSQHVSVTSPRSTTRHSGKYPMLSQSVRVRVDDDCLWGNRLNLNLQVGGRVEDRAELPSSKAMPEGVYLAGVNFQLQTNVEEEGKVPVHLLSPRSSKLEAVIAEQEGQIRLLRDTISHNGITSTTFEGFPCPANPEVEQVYYPTQRLLLQRMDSGNWSPAMRRFSSTKVDEWGRPTEFLDEHPCKSRMTFEYHDDDEHDEHTVTVKLDYTRSLESDATEHIVNECIFAFTGHTTTIDPAVFYGQLRNLTRQTCAYEQNTSAIFCSSYLRHGRLIQQQLHINDRLVRELVTVPGTVTETGWMEQTFRCWNTGGVLLFHCRVLPEWHNLVVYEFKSSQQWGVLDDSGSATVEPKVERLEVTSVDSSISHVHTADGTQSQFQIWVVNHQRSYMLCSTYDLRSMQLLKVEQRTYPAEQQSTPIVLWSRDTEEPHVVTCSVKYQ